MDTAGNTHLNKQTNKLTHANIIVTPISSVVEMGTIVRQWMEGW